MNAAPTNLFDLVQQRLAWADRRQALLAQNIANADTPGYVPKDAASFAQTLVRATDLPLVRTAPNDLAGVPIPIAETRQRPRQRSADGNAVSLDDQLIKVADTDTTQAMVTAIYRKYLAMFGEALGRTS